MNLTFVSARYANAAMSAAVAVTEEVGEITIVAEHDPADWAALLASGIAIAPAPLPPSPRFTFISARYANSAHTAVQAVTQEAGEVALTAEHEPDEWAALAASGIVIGPLPEPRYTYLSAHYANPDNTVAIAATAEAGQVAISAEDTPERWAALLASGIAIAPCPPPPVPQMVTNYQARAALLAAGLFGQVDAAVKAQGVDSPAFQAWEYANNVYRTSPLITELAAALGLGAQQIDALFVAASAIE